MTIIEQLNSKKDELEERLNNQYSGGGSRRRDILKHKITKIEALIAAYHSTPPPVNLSETEEILNQQVGFEEQKEKVLNSVKIKNYCEHNSVKREPLILCLVGSPGVGKTTFARVLAQALKKEFFMVALGGMSDSSLLLGVSEDSSGTETGQLTKALVETKTCDPLILLDEIDKVNSYGGNSSIHNCLNAILDPVQNQEIHDYYLDVKLDFSQVTFIVTVNDRKKIPKYLLSRMPVIVELPGYSNEQKKEIAHKFIKNKTKEKGVRQLKSALDSIFDYCLLHIDSEDDPEKVSEGKEEKKELENLRRELATLRGEKNNQTELKAIKFNSLLVLRQVRGQFTEKEYQGYEGRINTAVSREEIEVIMKEFLLKTKKPIKENQDKGIQDELKRNKDLNKTLEGKLKLFDDEIKKLKGEIQNFQGRGNKDKTLLVVVIIISTI
ncbi:9824_t:CDS:2 [Ambispora leptoticha]|uniref:9824_t:CDS:1 n=1 Tax=Ambispora leptoticha TaxID=144679 RepID=A0A9N9GV64_9GLOM|nr:9824_t:CDS:2 [Ambispora leptoticha]